MPIPPKGESDAETIIPVNAFEPLPNNCIFAARNLFPAVFLATASRVQACERAMIWRKIFVIPVPMQLRLAHPLQSVIARSVATWQSR